MLILFSVLGSAVFGANAQEQSFPGILCIADTNWEVQEWGANANTQITGAGRYEISYQGSMDGVSLLLIDIQYAADYIRSEELYLSSLSIYLDGQPVSVDFSKVITEELWEEGHYRIEIYHSQGNTADLPPVDPMAIQFNQTLTVEFTLSSRKVTEQPEEDKDQPVPSQGPSEPATNETTTQPTGDLLQPELRAQGSDRTWVLLLIIGLFVFITASSVAAFLAKKKR